MHKHTKLTPALRREVYERWLSGAYSQRTLALEYHVDKRVIGRVIERGKHGDFSVHSSINARYRPSRSSRRPKHAKKIR